jgi:selenoprotein W-related protein
MKEIISNTDFERRIESFTLVPSDGGRFEFTVNGDLLYSKLKTGRHADSGELTDLLRKYLAEVK